MARVAGREIERWWSGGHSWAKLGARESRLGPFEHRGDKTPKWELSCGGQDGTRRWRAERTGWGVRGECQILEICRPFIPSSGSSEAQASLQSLSSTPPQACAKNCTDLES